MDGDCWKRPHRITYSARLFLWSCCVIRFFGESGWALNILDITKSKSTMLGFLIPQSLDFICHNIGILQMFHFRLHISRDPRPPSIHHMKNPLPNITDTAQATSGPFPEINHREDLEHNAVSRVRHSTFHCDFLGNTHPARICKGKTILALCHYQSPAAGLK